MVFKKQQFTIVIFNLIIIILVSHLSSYRNLQINTKEVFYCTPTSSLTNHNPIIINGDIDFQIQALAEGWVGTGSFESPFIIENLMISATNIDQSAICITATSVYFIIRNCTLFTLSQDEYYFTGAGILLSHVSNAYIFDNYAESSCGFYLNRSSHNILTENIAFKSTWDGFYLHKSDNNILTCNKALNSSSNGFDLSNSNNNSLIHNVATYNDNIGINLIISHYNNLTSNEALNNDFGFHLERSNNNILTGNIAMDNSAVGIYLDWSKKNILTNNTVSNNVMDILEQKEPDFSWIRGIFYGLCTIIVIVLFLIFLRKKKKNEPH